MNIPCHLSRFIAAILLGRMNLITSTLAATDAININSQNEFKALIQAVISVNTSAVNSRVVDCIVLPALNLAILVPLTSFINVKFMNSSVKISINGQRLYEITHIVTKKVAESGIDTGLVTIFIRHTSASLLIQENADAAVLRDLENWLNRLVPENDDLYTHTLEGPDDMPAHIKGALTAVSLSIPVENAKMMLGTWQGIFVWEHRHMRDEREIVINIMSA